MKKNLLLLINLILISTIFVLFTIKNAEASYWNEWGLQGDSTIIPSPMDSRDWLVQKSINGNRAVAISNYKLSGDFSVEVDNILFNNPLPASNWWISLCVITEPWTIPNWHVPQHRFVVMRGRNSIGQDEYRKSRFIQGLNKD